MKLYTLIILFLSLPILTSIPICYSQPSLNYTEIAPHPRLLLNERDKISIENAIKSNTELRNIHDYIIKKSNDMLTEDVMIHKKKGKRLLAVSREVLKRVFYLSYAYRMTKDKKYLERVEKELITVCEFEDWNPTHFLDVGEMTMAVAIGYDWLYKDLKNSTKEIIRWAILNHAFKPSQEQRYNWFLQAINNWNQVCNAGLVYGALAIFEDHEVESKKIIERALESNLSAMKSYAPDGNYPEGAGYWHYGTGFEVMMIAALESALGSDAGLSDLPGFLESAEYILFMNGPTRLRFNYSDCTEKHTANIPIFWFAHKTKNSNLLYDEKKLMEKGLFFEFIDENRLLPTILIFAKDINFSTILPPDKNLWAGHGLTPVVLVRTDWTNSDSEYLGVKGGSATISHAHLDAGTFVYDSKGLRWAMDFGLQSYITLESKGIDLSNKAQNSQRWDVFRLNNKNHNTITINNKNHNIKGKAFLIEIYDTKAVKGGKFDMSEIFEGEIESAVRKVTIKNNSYLEVGDEIVTNSKEAFVRWTMATPAKVNIINQNTIELCQKDKKKIMTVLSENPIELKIWESANPGTEYDAPNPGTIMVGFESTVLANEQVSFRVTIKD